MKKLISIMLFAFVALAINAQSGKAVQLPVILGDTITNTATAYKIITVTGGYQTLAIQPVLTKVSGTAAGTVTMYGSQDGTNYYPLGDTLLMQDHAAAVSKLFKYTDPGYTYYKISYTGVGTMVVKWKVWYSLRKQSVIISTP
jgi:hypothetical protein